MIKHNDLKQHSRMNKARHVESTHWHLEWHRSGVAESEAGPR
ncbi:hypothetical protein E2C01_082270 [Portunus trituberculatus]|uniref:Uncharacterized protein n=1 Tax=Portunus trituberculatus TaxID=210409 RepID=A0A5B7IYM3_PORTR|nr:hypothetical protein [Portunus trituberculatus]